MLPSGFSAIHPTQNRGLAEQITQQGALVSEYAPEERSIPRRLMVRNGVIVALSLAVIVADASAPEAGGRDSGTMNAAKRAVRLGRPVYVVPGSDGARGMLADPHLAGAASLVPEETDWDRWTGELLSRTPSPARPAPQQGTLF